MIMENFEQLITRVRNMISYENMTREQIHDKLVESFVPEDIIFFAYCAATTPELNF